MLLELCPKLHFAIDLHRFHNVDLFQRGYYQIRLSLKPASKTIGARTEINVLRSSAWHTFPASVVDGSAVSKTVQVLYENETLDLHDTIDFNVQLLQRVDKLAGSIHLVLSMELWFIDKDKMNILGGSDVLRAFNCVCRRLVHCRLNLSKGLHTSRMLYFDFYHFAAVDFTIHASLVALLPKPITVDTKSTQIEKSASASNAVGLESASCQWPNLPMSDKLRAYHRVCCVVLLQAYDALQTTITQFALLLDCPLRIQSVDTTAKLEALCRRLDMVECNILQVLDQDRQLLSQELTVLCTQFLELYRGHPAVQHRLQAEQHLQRLKRFGEGFFYSEDSLTNLLSTSLAERSEYYGWCARTCASVRRSGYISNMPALSVAAPAVDGEPHSLTVVFEQRFINHNYINNHNDMVADSNSINNAETISVSESAKEAEMVGIRISCEGSVDVGHVQPRTKPEPPTINQSLSDTQQNSVDSTCSVTSVTIETESNSCVKSTSEPSLLGQVDLVAEAALYVQATRLDRSNSDTQLHSLLNGIGTTDVIMDMHMDTEQQCDWPPATANKNQNGALLAPATSTHSSVTSSATHSSSSSSSRWKRWTPKLRSKHYKDKYSTRKSVSENAQITVGIARTLSISKINTTDQSASQTTVAVSQSQSSASLSLACPTVDSALLHFVSEKEAFKRSLASNGFTGHLYSDCQSSACSSCPFLEQRTHANYASYCFDMQQVKHLIVCVHGLEGSPDDLRPYRNFLRLCFGAESHCVDFLMSEANQQDTFGGLQLLGSNLADEILHRLASYPHPPHKLSFITHSMGALIARACLATERLRHLSDIMHCFLSLNAPHCGLLYNLKAASLGVSLVQWWKKSLSLEQLSLRDQPAQNIRQCYLYELSEHPGLSQFRTVLLVGSSQDMYVPCHSALLQPCKAALNDTSPLAGVYTEMLHNVLHNLSVSTNHQRLVRYTAFHGFAGVSSRHKMFGRAAHVAVLDDDLFVERFTAVAALQYFL